MSHVAEGELHAWLDGALDHIGERRAAQVREHLRGCAVCQRSLAVEEALRARASDVLALAAPGASEMPPLEALMERAQSAPVPMELRLPSRMSRAARVGWAASVVIALGAGWMARDLLRRGTVVNADPAWVASRRLEPSVASAPNVASAAESTSGTMAAAGAAPVELQPKIAAPRIASVPDEAAGASDAAQPRLERAEPVLVAAGPDAGVQLRENPEVTAAAPTPAPDLPAPSALRPSANEPRAAAGNAAIPRPASARPDRTASSSAPAAEAPAIGIQRARAESARSDVPELFVDRQARAAAARQARGQNSRAVSSEADLEEALDLIVPGLEFLRAEWAEVVPGQRGLRVLQRLPSGDTLEIRFVRSGGAAADAAADPLAAVVSAPQVEGWSQVIQVHRDGGWLVARARLARSELEALLETAGQTGR